MSSLSRLRSRAMSSFSAALSPPASDTVRSYSGPKRCLSRSESRRPRVAMTTATMTITTAIATTIHIQLGI